MRSISFFLEDDAHEAFLTALIRRLACENNLDIETRIRSVSGGHGTVLKEFQRYVKDIGKDQEHVPDLIVVARDANCNGISARKRELDSNVPEELKSIVVYAIPDPHIERWLLLDTSAFKHVLGKGCSTPDRKCDRNRYKDILCNAVRSAGVLPLLGGVEHAEDIVEAMDLERMERTDDLGRFIKDIRTVFRRWVRTG